MTTSKNGYALIRASEGIRLFAYRDSTGVWTIGYGHTGNDVTPGLMITGIQADALLRQDVAVCERAVTALVKVPLTQGQFDALVDFVFNLGAASLRQSKLLRLLNASDYVGASSQFIRWNKAGGKVLAGLTKRRLAEQQLFLSQ